MSVSFDSDKPIETPYGFPEINWNNGNAQALHQVLGLPGDWVMGECSLAVARRAVIRGRNLSLVPFERLEEEVCGVPRTEDDGTVTMRPVRFITFGLDVEGIRRRVEQFATFVEAVAARGGTTIHWY
jgi:hypothetical protein